MGNQASQKSQAAKPESKNPTGKKDTTVTPTGKATPRSQKTNGKNTPAATPASGKATGNNNEKGTSRNNVRSSNIPKPASALTVPSEEDYFRYYSNSSIGYLDHDYLHPYFNYQHKSLPRKGYRLRVDTASTAMSEYPYPNVTGGEDGDAVEDADQEDSMLAEEEIYNRAGKAPATLNKSYKELLDYLMRGTELTNKPEITKTRAIMIWLSRQDVTSPPSGSRNFETPTNGLVRLSKNPQNEFSLFFSILCEKAGLQSVEINGIFKPASFELGKDEDLPSISWNAVYLEKKWQLVLPYFVCTRKTHEWLGADGELETTQGPVFNSMFFLVNPQHCIHWVYPDKLKWQLLPNALSKEEFLELPVIKSEFFQLGLNIITEHSYLLYSEEGRVRIDITSPLNVADEVYLWYDVTVISTIGKLTPEVKKLTEHDNLQKLVAMIKQNGNWMFQVTLPAEGRYKMTIYGSLDGEEFGTLLKFQLQCDQRHEKSSMLPYDPKEVGFGPGLAAKRAGLLLPSYTNGFYHVAHTDTFNVSFTIDADVTEVILVTATLKQTSETGIAEYSSHVHCVIDKDRGNVDVAATVPGDGVFMLSIWVQHDDGTNSKAARLACCYLLISNPDLPQVVETKNQREARQNLKRACEADTLDGIESAISMCVYQRIPMEDDQVAAANTRVEVLQLTRDIGFTFQNPTLSNVRGILSKLEGTKYVYCFRHEVTELQKLKHALKWKKNYALKGKSDK